MTLLDEIQQRLSFLFDCGFTKAESDDWTVILTYGNLLLRITHDRADWFIDVGFTFLPDNWYELWDVLSLLRSKGLSNQDWRSTNKLGGIKSALQANIEEIMQVEKYKEDICSLRAN